MLQHVVDRRLDGSFQLRMVLGFASTATARPIAATTRVFIGVLLSYTRGPSPATAEKSAYAVPYAAVRRS